MSPNPLVGAVIVKNGEIISEDYHRVYGGYHAERNAILKMGDYDFSDCEIYCNLEPCTHYGKTPPCADLIIDKNFKRVIFGAFDPNPLVAGKSLEKFRKAGITTAFKVLESESRYLNRFFFKHIKSKIPWVIAKWAESDDGFISSGKGKQERITGSKAQKDVHIWRKKIDAILVGTNTTLIDNPSLNIRLVEGRNPVKIIIDRDLKVPLEYNIFKEADKTIIFCRNSANYYKKEEIRNLGAKIIELDADYFSLSELLKQIGSLRINSLIVEGGANLLNQLFEQNLVDEVHRYKSNLKLKSGLKVNFNEENFKVVSRLKFTQDSKTIFIKENFH